MSYVAPIKDMLFVLHELAGLHEIQQAAGLRGRNRRDGAGRARRKRAAS